MIVVEVGIVRETRLSGGTPAATHARTPAVDDQATRLLEQPGLEAGLRPSFSRAVSVPRVARARRRCAAPLARPVRAPLTVALRGR
ncbi:MAG: hypothetical protein AB7I32_17500 [Gammaproteobacteria bacterium]